MSRFKRFLQYGTRKDVKLFIGVVASIALVYLLCYELWWYEIPASTVRIERAGVLASRIFYSILASSIFFYISQYFPVILPRRERKLKVLDIVFHKAISIDWYLSRVRSELNVMYGEFADVEKWRTILDSTDVNTPVSNFPNWYEYLRHLRERIVELTRGITIHSEHLSLEFLQEVVIIEQQLLTPGIFEGPPYINTGNLRWAEIQLQEVLVHNRILQDIRVKEWKVIKKELDTFGKEYRETNFKSYDDAEKKKSKKNKENE
jgi:hypothetical protein